MWGIRLSRLLPASPTLVPLLSHIWRHAPQIVPASPTPGPNARATTIAGTNANAHTQIAASSILKLAACQAHSSTNMHTCTGTHTSLPPASILKTAHLNADRVFMWLNTLMQCSLIEMPDMDFCAWDGAAGIQRGHTCTWSRAAVSTVQTVSNSTSASINRFINIICFVS